MYPSDNVARLREIKRLLDRIQALPHIAGLPDTPPNGLHRAPPPLPPLPLDADEEPQPMLLARDRIPPPPPLELPRRQDQLFDSSRALVPVQPKSAGMSPWMFVIATAINAGVAAALAVVITLGIARRDATTTQVAEAEKVAASIKVAEAQPEPPPSRPLELLPVGSPTEPLRLEARKPARLPLQIRPEEAVQESYILLLSGLPANAALSGASRMGADSWLVSPGALEQIEIVVPEWSTSTVEVGVELRRTNGAVVAQSKLWLAVPPPASPKAEPLTETALADLVRSGDRLLNRGDVMAARAYYEKAAAMGSAQGALALGATYDPRRLWSLGVFGTVGNKERARQWYQRAAELGHPEAKDRIRALK
ncbi:MAG: sel1 repeat family protein [Hyphomicrobiaceae bacterium]|nr:sel1 repeat family protein [Hyphomicrobiaceae bacterium]